VEKSQIEKVINQKKSQVKKLKNQKKDYPKNVRGVVKKKREEKERKRASKRRTKKKSKKKDKGLKKKWRMTNRMKKIESSWPKNRYIIRLEKERKEILTALFLILSRTLKKETQQKRVGPLNSFWMQTLIHC
jgi:hypothetical protein